MSTTGCAILEEIVQLSNSKSRMSLESAARHSVPKPYIKIRLTPAHPSYLTTMAYCDRCDRYFNSERALNMHERDSPNHNFCCNKDFATESRLQQHWTSSAAHDYCQYCDEHFDDSEELQEHFEQNHDYCSLCRKVFASNHGLQQHNSQVRHVYCPSCDRTFQNENNLRNHLRSSLHSARDIHCPFGCGMSFITNSHLVLHLEAGGCSSGMDRNSVNKLVRRYDRSNVITDPSRLITSGDEEISYIATSASWNGSGFECYLCHNQFCNLRALNQHLASPAHQARFYICRGPDCGSRFSTLSALCQHIESEKCGVRKFRAVQAAMDNLFGTMRRLTL